MEIKIEGSVGAGIDDSMQALYDTANRIKKVMKESNVTQEVIDDVVVTMNFNDWVLTSNDSIDDAYIKITGKTKAENDEEERKWKEEYDAKEREWEESIPSKVQPYCDAARGVIREDKYELWDEIVPIRLRDLYHGIELGATLDILKEWNKTRSFKKCHEIIVNQGHSGMSHGLVLSMVREFAAGESWMVDKLIRTLNKVEYDENA